MKKLSNIIKKKSLQKIYLGTVMASAVTILTVFSGATNVHADTWSATLPRACVDTQAGSYLRTSGTSKVSLTRIENGPSYYINARMYNLNLQPRTSEITVQQNAGYKAFKDDKMSSDYRYILYVGNDYFETTPRSAYGYISI